MTSRTVVILLLVLVASKTFSQGIRGEIRDVNGDPVPYAAIFIKELTRGTTCNALGQFSLPLPSGKYNIFFRSLGYTEVSRMVTVENGFTELAIELPPQTYMIPEVRISASGEDPAYWIMRKAIGLANYHLNEVSSYQAEIYIKGTAIIEKLPRAIKRRIEVNELEVEEDEAYMLESLNEVTFTAPDNYEMKVVASQNTLPGYTENVNPMDYVNASLYQQEIEGVISPLARNAFAHYRFSFEGTFLEGTHVVNKIRVIPKRKSQQLVEGTLFIVEDLWNIHSSDLSVETIAGKVSLKQLYANVIMDAWLPVNHQITVDVQIVGVKGTATYVSSLEYRNVTLNPNLPETYFVSVLNKDEEDEKPEKEPISRDQEKINELLSKEELSNREAARLSRLIQKETEQAEGEDGPPDLDETGTSFTVAEDAVKNDRDYWNSVRPIPLTPEEQLTLNERDSILRLRPPDTENDSLKNGSRRLRKLTFSGLVNGKNYFFSKGRFRFWHGGLADLEQLGYNTVDGLVYGQNFKIDWRPDTLYGLRSNLLAGYAFHRRAPLLTWDTNLLYAPMARGKVALNMHYRSADFNTVHGIPSPTNMAYTLLLRENYLKMYERIGATLYNRIDPFNGMVLTTSLTYGQQRALQNNSLFSVFFRNADPERFTENIPGERNENAPELLDHKHLTARVDLSYTPRQFFRINRYRKIYTDSRWPTFSISYHRAFAAETSGWSEYSRMEARIDQSFEVGLLSELSWSMAAGMFADTSSMHFSDFRHFQTTPLYVDMAGLGDGLMFTDYYQASTNRYWLNMHARFTSSYLFVKFLPWFSERLWKESLELVYLHTPETRNYLQLGYSMEEIFFLVDVGVYVGFMENGTEDDRTWGYRGITGRLNFRF